MVTPPNPLPPTNNFCLYPPPVFRCFWKDPLMTPHYPTSSILHCYHPFPPPLKILIVHILTNSSALTKSYSKNIAAPKATCRNIASTAASGRGPVNSSNRRNNDTIPIPKPSGAPAFGFRNPMLESGRLMLPYVLIKQMTQKKRKGSTSL